MLERRYPVMLALAAGASIASSALAQPDDRSWRLAVDGDWSDDGAWDPVGSPNNNGPNTFNAFLSVTGAPYVVTLDLNVTIVDFTLDSADATLDLTANSLTVEGDYAQPRGLVRSGGIGSVTVEGTSFLSGAALQQLMYFSNGTVELDGSGVCEVRETCIIHNGSRVNWSGPGGVRFFGGGEFDNLGSSVFEITNDQSMTWDNVGTQPMFVNAGTVVKTTATGVTRFTGVEFVNDGTLDVTDGTIRADTVTLAAGNTLDRGTWIVRDNATLSLPNSTIEVNDADVELHGAGARFTAFSNNLTDVGANGSLLIADGHTFTARAGDFTNNGEVTVDAGSQFRTVGTATINVINTAAATLSAQGGSTIQVRQGDFTNDGTLNVAAGSRLDVRDGEITNFNNGVFTNGIFNIEGEVSAPDLEITQVEAELNFDNPTSRLTNSTNGQSALAGLDTIGPAGSLRISNGRNLSLDPNGPGNLALSGQLTIGQGLLNEPISTFTVPGTLTQTAGVLRFGGGRLNVGELDLQGGAIQGNGTINGRAVVNGVIDPGGSPGLLRILGDLVLMDTPQSGLTIEIAGLAPITEFDHVRVAEEMRFEGGSAGTLNVVLLGGFVPVQGDSFQIMSWGLRAGQGEFAQVNLPTLPGGLEFRLIYRDRGLFATVTPAPAGVAVGAFALLAATRRRRA